MCRSTTTSAVVSSATVTTRARAADMSVCCKISEFAASPNKVTIPASCISLGRSGVGLNDQIGEVQLVEHAPNVFAHAPMAANDDVIVHASIQGVGKGSALVQPLPEEREFLEKRLLCRNQVEQEGVDHNRNSRGGED